MTDPLTAINSRLQAIDFSIGNLAVDKPEWGKGLIVLRMVEDEVMPHIRALAALVREYGHVRRCYCHICSMLPGATCAFAGLPEHEDPYHDSRCLPESREEKP